MSAIVIKPAGRQGYHVIHGDRIAVSLSWGEMLDLVVRLSAPFGQQSPSPFLMLTKAEWIARARRQRDRRREAVPY